MAVPKSYFGTAALCAPGMHMFYRVKVPSREDGRSG